MLFAIAEASKSGGKSFYWYSIPEILVLDLIHNLWMINELYKIHDKFWNAGSIYVIFGTYVVLDENNVTGQENYESILAYQK